MHVAHYIHIHASSRPSIMSRSRRGEAGLGCATHLQHQHRARAGRAGRSTMRDLEAPSHSHGSDEVGAVTSSWWSGGGGGDPEAKRRRRIAAYKAYAVEARVKASLRKGFRWIKDRCTGLVVRR